MNWLDQIMSSDAVYRIGWAIIHSAWQGLGVAAVFGVLLVVIPKRMSSLRYGCGCLALLAMLTAFCATAWMAGPRPDAPSPANPWRTQTPAPVQSAAPSALPARTPANDQAPSAEPARTPDASLRPEPKPWVQRFAQTVSPWTEYVCGVWLVGVFAMSVWNLGGWIAVRRLRMIGTWPPPERLVGLLDELRGRFSIRRTVKLLQSTVVKVPMTIGWLKPVILVPASILSELSPQHIEAIIAHELAHVRRCDYLVNLLQTVVETLFFHHPAVWWISRRVRLEREYCCDNAVVKLTSDQVNYARALTEIAERRDTLPHVAVAADGGSLVGRIRRILGMERESSLLRNRSAGWAIVALVFIAAAFAVGIGLSSHSLWAAPYIYGADANDGTYATFQKMLGTWQVNAEKSTGAGSVKRIEIKPDATCIRHESAEDDPNPKTFYDHIRLKDNGLIVSGYWGKQTFALALEGDTMTWTEGNTHFVFERITKTPALAPKAAATEPRCATLPDLDEQPAFVDLATGDMVVMPEGIEKDDEALRTHLTQLAKGDLGFDKQLIVLRGGSACLWDGVNSTAMASTVHEPFNIRAYDLAEIPCRLLITTGDGKQFDVNVLEKTADGGLKIDYRPVGTRAAQPAAARFSAVSAADLLASQVKVQLQQVRSAMDVYEVDHGKRPDLTAGWAPLTEKAGKGPYIKAAPVNPFTGGSAAAADASGDWQFDPAAGTLKAVVPLTLERARQLGLDVENDVVCAAGGEVAMSNLAEMCPPIGASERVRYALDKIASLMRYVESQKDGDIAALSGYFDQINEFCDDLQGKNGPAPGGEEWGVMAADQIEAVIKLLGEIEQTAEGCRELSRGGYKELLDQHWQSLKYEYSRLCTALQTAARTQLQSGAEPAGTHDHFVGWYRLSKDIVFPVLKIDGMFYAPCRGMEIPFKKTAEGLEWALTPSSMAGTTIGRLPGMNQYYLRNMDRQTIEQLEASNQPNPLGYGKNQPITRIETPKGLLEMTASIPRRLDDFVGWYQPTWFPAFRFHLRKDMDQYIWQEQRMGSRLGEWASAAKEIELTPLTDDTGFGLGNERLTYNKSLKRYEIVKTGSQLLRMPLSRVPEPTPETDAKAPWPPAVTGIPAWN